MAQTVRYPSSREMLKFAKAIQAEFPTAIRHSVTETTQETVVFTVKFADGSTTQISFNR